VLRTVRSHAGERAGAGIVILTLATAVGCTSSAASDHAARAPGGGTVSSAKVHPAGGASSPGTARPQLHGQHNGQRGVFTIGFAGDVHFMDRTRRRLDKNPRTVFAQATPGLRRPDLTMVNLETAITTRGVPQAKEYHFRAPAKAFDALRDAGIDVATMANNHAADYGRIGLHDTLRAIARKKFPTIGIGRDVRAAFAPYKTKLHGVKVAIFAADQVLVRRAKHNGYVVIVYLHWGIEYQTCPSTYQTRLAGRLARAGASAVIGTHAHVLQGAGWKHNGTYVAYGLGNYLWWMSFHNIQDDNGLLTLTFHRSRVTGAHFAPSHLDHRGVPVPSTGAQKRRIMTEWRRDRSCTGLAARPPG
jgi:poly-gamma-glutamate synthesis protein (capsule biosynthesis protein)